MPTGRGFGKLPERDLEISAVAVFLSRRRIIEQSMKKKAKTVTSTTLFNCENLSAKDIHSFQKLILNYYRKQGRKLPWRKTSNPYYILVSEIMLQQTQVERVIEKYTEFISRFPDVGSLAQAPQHSVIRSWQGLGYNRRAIALKKSAEEIEKKFKGTLPRNYEELLSLPGVGPSTASAVCVFAYNQPRVFIETNIRAVFIHYFFSGVREVKDDDILAVVGKTLYRKNPRRWYNALMDQGVLLKKLYPNPGRKSAHYNKQSPFKDSDRQIRGQILKILIGSTKCTEDQLLQILGKDERRVKKILEQLYKEGFIQKKRKHLYLN